MCDEVYKEQLMQGQCSELERLAVVNLKFAVDAFSPCCSPLSPLPLNHLNYVGSSSSPAFFPLAGSPITKTAMPSPRMHTRMGIFLWDH